MKRSGTLVSFSLPLAAGAFVSAIAAISQAAGVPTSLAITNGNNQTAPAGTALPLPLTVSVTDSSGAGVAGVTVNFAVTSGIATLSSSGLQTDANGNASVTLTFGPVAGSVTVTAAIGGSAVLPVHFAETASAGTTTTCPIGPPQISSLNSATDFGRFSYFASGSYLEVKGINLAVDTRQWATSDFQGSNAPTGLDGSKVSIDGLPGYVSYISSQQINVQAPADSATGLVPIVVTNCAGTSNTVTLQKYQIAPAMLAPAQFYVGKQYLVALFASDLVQGAVTYVGNPGLVQGANFRPAKPGDLIVVYGLGFGPVIPATPPGVVASGITNLPGVSVSFDSTPAQISYAGLYPGFVGLYEFFVTVPDVPDGDSEIGVSVNQTAVPQTFYLTIQQ